MAESKQEGGGSSPFNFSTLLAILTVFGGAWLVSQKLSSDRPLPQSYGTQDFVGEQTVEARLWEDPFKRDASKIEDGGAKEPPSGFETLNGQIAARTKSSKVLLLPVMLFGGHYSEEQESRIRSRFAIVAALGQLGYAPEDAEHIGAAHVLWPRQEEINKAKDDGEAITNLKLDDSGTNTDNTNSIHASAEMGFRFEWYRPRTFYKIPEKERPKVLVLWLNETYFGDEPLLRLAMFFAPFLEQKDATQAPDIALIGPRGSSTLRAMLPGEWGKEGLKGEANLWAATKAVLTRVRLYCATPAAMDEVLVNKSGTVPREAVQEALVPGIFKSFHNFAVTDGQLAEDAFKELSLRGLDFTKKKNHLVLISEWDTFYGRMLSLTYEAQLAELQSGHRTNRLTYINQLVDGSPLRPPNFHPFVYLRGLDGQTVVHGENAGEKSESQKSGSWEEAQKWAPDVNKAEGPAQFDYLNRLGEALKDLERRLHNEGGHITAVGIVGSDTYDTLLILQALRERFSDALFFTTDLDVRFYHPRERKWARNLIVLSSYGLTLAPELQQQVASFRDSSQTAQFAAALAALGDERLSKTNLLPLQPRRFEIGNRTAVDLSTTNVVLDGDQRLHPLRLQEAGGTVPKHERTRVILGALLVLLFAAGLCWYWDPMHQMTFGAIPHIREALQSTWEEPSETETGVRRAEQAVIAGKKIFKIRSYRFGWFCLFVIGFSILGSLLGLRIWKDSFDSLEGEPFSLTNGTSAWPAEILRLGVFAAGAWFSFELYYRLREGFLDLTRKFRLMLVSSKDSPRPGRVSAVELWQEYWKRGGWWKRVGRIILQVFLYLVFCTVIFTVSDQHVSSPVRGKEAQVWNGALLLGALLTFLVLAFLTLDAARLCRWFIVRLGESPTEYPRATLQYFSRQRGDIDPDYLDEWIDLQLIAELTEHVGRLVYFPAWLILLLLLARNSWWDAWPWPVALIIIFLLNFALALAGVLVLQQAARAAKANAEETLTAKVKRLQAQTAPTPAHRDAEQAEKLLQEIRNIRRGAFVSFWDNPVIGAIFLSSGGTTLIQILVWFLEK
jgi:hypothetical protein